MGRPTSPSPAFDQLLQISSVLSSLNANLAASHAGSETEDGAYETGWTAVNRPMLNSFMGLIAVDDTESDEVTHAALTEDWDVVGHDINDGRQPEIYLKVEEGQVISHHVPTGIYVLNAQAGSWSGRLLEDEEAAKDRATQATAEWKSLRRVLEMADAKLKAAERQTAQPFSTANIPTHGLDNTDSDDFEAYRERQEKQAAEKDQVLRYDMNIIKQTLLTGYVLSLEHTGGHDVECNMDCKYRYCSSDYQCIAAHSYYITLFAPGDATIISRYCLTCFEALWNGELLVGELPDPRVLKLMSGGEVQECNECACHSGLEDAGRPVNAWPSANALLGDLNAAAIPNHFGNLQYNPLQSPAFREAQFEAPASLMASKHAPKPGEYAVSQLGGRSKAHPPSTSAMRSTLQPSSSSITTSNNYNRFAPTRFQHLAYLIQPGQGLNKVEEAALAIWKAATKRQFQCLTRSSIFAPTSATRSMLLDDHDQDLHLLKETMGLSDVKFSGRDLSEVLAQVDARKDL